MAKESTKMFDQDSGPENMINMIKYVGQRISSVD
jgi:hypothetical protein